MGFSGNWTTMKKGNRKRGEQPLYRREPQLFIKMMAIITRAWIYWYKGDVTGKPVIASGDVLEYIKVWKNLEEDLSDLLLVLNIKRTEIKS